MKTLLFIVLPLMAVSLMAAPQAMAQEDDACAHDVAMVEALYECVVHAIAQGHLSNAGVAQGLLAKADAAQDAVDRGQDDVVVNILMAFIHQVEAQAGKSILEPHASHLVEHAQRVIDELSV
jgi:hypothetical protein